MKRYCIFVTDNRDAAKAERAGELCPSDEAANSWRFLGEFTDTKEGAKLKTYSAVAFGGSLAARLFTHPKRGLGREVYTCVATQSGPSEVRISYEMRSR